MTRRSFLILFAFAAALRFLLIWQAPLWYDENFSLIVARLPYDRFWQAILGDVHPPLYYLIIRPIAQLTTAPWLIRLPSAIFSLASLAIAWKMFERMRITPAVRLAALALMTILPTQLWFAQEARMYALLEMLVLLSFYALLDQRWWLMGLSNLALLYTQNYGLFYVAVFLGIIIILHLGKPDLIKGLNACVMPISGWLPWYAIMRDQMAIIENNYWITVTMARPSSVLSLFPQLFWGPTIPIALTPFAWIVLYAALIGGTLFLLLRRPAGWFAILAMSYGPLIIAGIASLMWQPVLMFRPLLGSTPFMILLIVSPIGLLIGPTERFTIDDLTGKIYQIFYPYLYENHWSIRGGLFMACFTMPLLITGLVGYYYHIDDLKGVNINGALAYVRAHWQPGDLIMHTDDGSLINLLPYSADLPQVRLADCAPTTGGLSVQTRTAIGIPIVDAVPASAKRVWVFAPRSPMNAACYENHIAPYTQGDPVYLVDDTDYIMSGVWLLEER